MERQFRLTNSNEIKRVRRVGRSYAHPLVILIASENGRDHSQFAVTAGRSIGNAVKRNRAKRLIRAALHTIHRQVQRGWNIVLIARAPLAAADYHQTLEAIQSLFQEANLL